MMEPTITAQGCDRLKGKRAFVSAAAQGIGRATALRLAAEGADVIASDVNEEKLNELSGPRITLRPMNAADPEAVAAEFDESAGVDILVNCVGWVHHGTILDCGPEDWSRSFALNVDPMFHAIRAALPKMRAAGSGSIVNIASAASSIKGFPNRFAYGASKAAVIGLTKAVAADFIAEGIRCNAICPGTVASPSLNDRINAFDDPAAARSAFIARQPMGRLGTPEEIAACVAYLAADESAFMTGAAIQLDGGATY
ncbi:SDR family oxidoreductase [Oceaniglobus trochenteri]|uniref:SDR family oxidoreductase n=1 Tax=Oceaniglobus trochenteri TaxID=2763260 RepID=UPI001CFFA459|nr:SDR family oxidoreductase [Oceaniglobus trochenteri]